VTGKPSAHRARSVARLAAVQALYQMETAEAGSEAVIREFSDFRFDKDIEGVALAPADEAYFAVLVRGAVEHQARVDKAIRTRLAEGWRLERIDATLRAILRVGAFELIAGEVPSEVVIDEYVEIAKSFFDGPEAGFVNGALDGIARDERPA
jgi:N utilization substance protein B